MSHRLPTGLVLLFMAIFVFALLLTAYPAPTGAQVFTETPILAATSTALPSPTPLIAAAGCVEPLPLVEGSIVYLKGGVNMRSQATTSGALVGYYEESTRWRVVSGPVCANGYNWWELTGGPGIPGWAVEGTPEGYFIIPAGVTLQELLEPPCAPAMNLTAGEELRLFTGVRVRQVPGLSGLVLTVAPIDTLVTVLEGPQCVDELNWWRVQVAVLDILYEGWMVEGFVGQPLVISELERLAIEEGRVCADPLTLEPGDRAFVDYRDSIPKSLRTTPGTESPLMFTLVDGVPLEIMDGPICADSMNWWLVRVLARSDVVGWLAEGGPQGYWISRLDRLVEPESRG